MNAKPALYVASRLSGKTELEAYAAAGYTVTGKAAESGASRLEALPHVAAALAKANSHGIAAAVEQAIADTPVLLAKLKAIIDCGDTKTRDRIAAIKLYGDNLGSWTPKPVLPPSPIDLSHLTDDAKRALLNALRSASVVATP